MEKRKRLAGEKAVEYIQNRYRRIRYVSVWN